MYNQCSAKIFLILTESNGVWVAASCLAELYLEATKWKIQIQRQQSQTKLVARAL